jgi:hypothetical protein
MYQAPPLGLMEGRSLLAPHAWCQLVVAWPPWEACSMCWG